MDQVKLTAPHLSVTMDHGARWDVQATNRDLVAWDRTRNKQRPPWPKTEDAPFLWMTFLAWSASAREGFTALSWAEFEASCIDVANSGTDDDEGEGPGDPTRPGPGPG